MMRSRVLWFVLFLQWFVVVEASAGLPKLQWHLDKQKTVFLQLGVEFFARPEWQTNRGDFSGASEDSDFYVAYRIRLMGDLSYKRQVGFRLQLQDSRYWGNGLTQGGKVRFNNSTSDQFTREVYLGLQLFEAFFYLGAPALGLQWQVGRMRIVYGDSFFIGDPGFVPPGQSFDGMRLRWKANSLFRLDLLWLMVRESVASANVPNCQGNCFFEGDNFAGAYAQITPGRANTIDLYAFYYERAPRNDVLQEPSRLAYLGVRYKLKLGSFWLHAEGKTQIGRHQERSLLAASGIIRFRYTIPVALRPFVGGQFMMSTGDGDPNDNEDNNFIALFHNRRKFYGLVNLFGSSNILQPVVEVGFSPHTTLTVQADARYTWKFDPKGSLVGGGNHSAFIFDLTGADGIDVGTEFNLRVYYRPMAGVLFDLGAGMFLPSTALSVRDAGGTVTRSFGTDPAFMVFSKVKFFWR